MEPLVKGSHHPTLGDRLTMAMLNYAALVIIGALGMSILDQDHAHVSIEEWAIYGVMLFAAWKLVQEMVQYFKDNEGGL